MLSAVHWDCWWCLHWQLLLLQAIHNLLPTMPGRSAPVGFKCRYQRLFEAELAAAEELKDVGGWTMSSEA